MYKWHYDKDFGEEPQINDRVCITYTNSKLDGRLGRVIGWAGPAYLAIILLDNSLPSGEEAITIPVVALLKDNT